MKCCRIIATLRACPQLDSATVALENLPPTKPGIYGIGQSRCCETYFAATTKCETMANGKTWSDVKYASFQRVRASSTITSGGQKTTESSVLALPSSTNSTFKQRTSPCSGYHASDSQPRTPCTDQDATAFLSSCRVQALTSRRLGPCVWHLQANEGRGPRWTSRGSYGAPRAQYQTTRDYVQARMRDTRRTQDT
jgi:hypothetical protein